MVLVQENRCDTTVGALDPHVRSRVEGSVAAALVTPRFLAPRGGKEVSLSREAGGGLRSDESSYWLANAEQRPDGGARAAHVFLSTYIAKWLRSARARSTHRGDTLRDSLGYGGDVATRDNTPRDTVSHSMLRLRAGAHESGRPA